MKMPVSETTVHKTVLENGLIVLSEKVPACRTIALGVWIKTGSRSETVSETGMAHFIEHMLFKGTTRRSALKIARSLEELGGNLNAFTAKEETCYYIHISDAHLKIAVSVLADMVCHSLFREKDIAREKQVILEEISAVKDSPEEYIFDVFQEKIFPDQALGYPILGYPDTVAAFDRDAILSFRERFYQPDNIVVTVAGNVDHDRLVRLVESHFLFNGHARPVPLDKARAAHNVHYTINESLNQAHICVGQEAISCYHDSRFDLMALNTFLGGGMSSRLFQVLRERNAFAYAVYSFLEFYRDTGLIGFYLGTDYKNQKRALDKLYQEIDKVRRTPLSARAIRNIREQIKGGILLSMENVPRRMNRLAKNEIYFGRYIPMEEVTSKIDSISAETFYRSARDFLQPENLNSVIISPLKN